MLWPALIDEPYPRAGGALRLHGSFGKKKTQERNTRGMFNHFVISENQKRRLFSGLELIFMGTACSLRVGSPYILPWPQVHTHERYSMLEGWEGSGGKEPIIQFQIKTQRSSLMWAFGRNIILSNRKASTKTHQAILLNNIKTQKNLQNTYLIPQGELLHAGKPTVFGDKFFFAVVLIFFWATALRWRA